jgi:hypothetical protein
MATATEYKFVFDCQFEGGPYDGRMGKVGLRSNEDHVLLMPTGNYRLVDGPVLRAMLAGADPTHLCARAIFEPDQPSA